MNRPKIATPVPKTNTPKPNTSTTTTPKPNTSTTTTPKPNTSNTSTTPRKNTPTTTTNNTSNQNVNDLVKRLEALNYNGRGNPFSPFTNNIPSPTQFNIPSPTQFNIPSNPSNRPVTNNSTRQLNLQTESQIGQDIVNVLGAQQNSVLETIRQLNEYEQNRTRFYTDLTKEQRQEAYKREDQVANTVSSENFYEREAQRRRDNDAKNERSRQMNQELIIREDNNRRQDTQNLNNKLAQQSENTLNRARQGVLDRHSIQMDHKNNDLKNKELSIEQDRINKEFALKQQEIERNAQSSAKNRELELFSILASNDGDFRYW